MTREQAARRYLQADMAANYTGLPGEAKQAHEATMRALARKHAGVAEHALVGADADFDKPLSAGEREHQRYMREREGLTHGQVLERRKAIREASKPTRPRPRPRAAVRAGARAGRTYYRGTRSLHRAVGAPLQSTGSLVMEAIGVGIALGLAYLLLNEKGRGPAALSKLLEGVTALINAVIAPIDPLQAFSALGANTSSSSSSSRPASEVGPGGPVAATPTQRKKLDPAFGPAPGIGTVITPIGGIG